MSKMPVTAERAARLASQFLEQAQDSDGAWRDFQLLPGRAESWTTAYVAARVLQAQRCWPYFLMDHCLRRAARFLSASRQPGGWSYNQRCDPDSDTTAQVILYLSRAGEPVTVGDYAALAKFQLADGHFATYKNCGARPGWSRGHADVTTVGMQAMSQILDPRHDILRRAERSLREHINGRHAAESYWWVSRNYLAREFLMLARSYRGAPQLFFGSSDAVGDGSCFDRGLALELAALIGDDKTVLVAALEELLRLQLADGSWPVQPILRVTDPRACSFDDPLFHQSALAADDRRTFTTATILGAISTACARWPGTTTREIPA
ncbi:MAG: hypothetical protein ACLPHI_02630 [Terriglobales bacterium]